MLSVEKGYNNIENQRDRLFLICSGVLGHFQQFSSYISILTSDKKVKRVLPFLPRRKL